MSHLPPEPEPKVPEPATSARRLPGRRTVVRAVLVLAVAFALGALVSVVHLPYAIMSPGPATDVLSSQQKADGGTADRIVVTGRETFPTSGSLDFTTVRVVGGPGFPVNAVDVITAWLDPNRDVFPVDAIFPPDVTKEQVAEENRAEMSGSQHTAAAVALRALGYDVPQVVTVARVPSDAPAAGQLRVGDVLVSIGGVPVTDAATTRAAVQQVAPGQSVDVVVERDGSQVTVHPKTGKADDGRTVLGVGLGVDFRLPFGVSIDAGNVGGPSAGLMFSLGVYDKLTDGPLTGGRSVAGTGTIGDDGSVGAIDGIRQKMVGARQAGAGYFLAPAANCPDVDRVPDGMTVVKVETFDQARQAVESIGRGETASLPHC
ncbi:MAG: PDZ domain-containing protein [Dermatophilaceae bacterium]